MVLEEPSHLPGQTCAWAAGTGQVYFHRTPHCPRERAVAVCHLKKRGKKRQIGTNMSEACANSTNPRPVLCIKPCEHSVSDLTCQTSRTCLQDRRIEGTSSDLMTSFNDCRSPGFNSHDSVSLSSAQLVSNRHPSPNKLSIFLERQTLASTQHENPTFVEGCI